MTPQAEKLYIPTKLPMLPGLRDAILGPNTLVIVSSRSHPTSPLMS